MHTVTETLDMKAAEVQVLRAVDLLNAALRDAEDNGVPYGPRTDEDGRVAVEPLTR